jgi:pimeloyl-ACP methyl ester carboxylesterase
MIRVGGLSLWVEQSGNGPAVLLVAGLGYSNWCWRELQSALSPDYGVISFDNRGTGRSDKPAGPYSIAMLADDAAGLLRALKVPSAHVVGHSMGGYIAMTLALAQPEMVRTLTLVGTTCGGPGTVPVPETTLRLWSEVAGLPPEQSARRSMPTSFAPGWTERNPQRFERLLAARLRYPTPPQCWAAQYAACAAYIERGIDAGRIRCPTLVIHGTEDRVVPYPNGVTLARRIPGARLVTLPGGGHLPPQEDPEGFAGLVRLHLAARERPRP